MIENSDHFRVTFIAKFIMDRSSRPNVFLGKRGLKICSKFIGEHPCRSAISIKLQSNFIEIALWHGCSPINLLHIFRTPFSMNTSGWLLLYMIYHQLRLPLSWLSFIYFLCFRGTELFKEHLEKYEKYSKNISFWGHRVRALKKNFR